MSRYESDRLDRIEATLDRLSERDAIQDRRIQENSQQIQENISRLNSCLQP